MCHHPVAARPCTVARTRSARRAGVRPLDNRPCSHAVHSCCGVCVGGVDVSRFSRRVSGSCLRLQVSLLPGSSAVRWHRPDERGLPVSRHLSPGQPHRGREGPSDGENHCTTTAAVLRARAHAVPGGAGSSQDTYQSPGINSRPRICSLCLHSVSPAASMMGYSGNTDEPSLLDPHALHSGLPSKKTLPFVGWVGPQAYARHFTIATALPSFVCCD